MMSLESKEITKQIEALQQRKRELRNKDTLEKKKKYTNNSNVLIRVSKKMEKELEEIQNERIRLGRDERPLSKPKITELVVSHKDCWGKIKEDIILFNVEKGEPKNE